MEIQTTVTRRINDVSGKEVQEGELVIVSTGNGDFIGEYRGIDRHGALTFESAKSHSQRNYLPRSINAIYHVSNTMTEE